jgi:hypothetical protein
VEEAEEVGFAGADVIWPSAVGVLEDVGVNVTDGVVRELEEVLDWGPVSGG